MFNLKRILPSCVLAMSAFAQGNSVPDSVLHVTKTEAGNVEFRVGASPIFAVGVSDISGEVHWNDYCQQPFQPGQLAHVADLGGKIDTVVAANGVYGNPRVGPGHTALDELSKRYTAADNEYHKWLDLAKSFSADSKTFVQQMTSALADVQLPDETQDNFVAVKLIKGNLTNLLQQTEKDPREMALWYLNHMTGVFDGCLSAVGSRTAQ